LGGGRGRDLGSQPRLTRSGRRAITSSLTCKRTLPTARRSASAQRVHEKHGLRPEERSRVLQPEELLSKRCSLTATPRLSSSLACRRFENNKDKDGNVLEGSAVAVAFCQAG
jgi:hypothetical protein